MARGANFKIGASSDRHNFRDWDDRFHQPNTHLTPEQITKDNIYLRYDLAGDLSRENCKGFSRRIMRDLKKEYIETTDYGQRTGSVHSQAKLVLEACINLEHHHTKEDLEKLVKDLEEKLNVRTIYLMAHFDEGHVDKNGEVIVNSHAHFKFTPLVNGEITRRDKVWSRKAQDVVAESLNMERGEDVRISGRDGLDWKPFRQSKRDEEKLTEELNAKFKKEKASIDNELKLAKKELRTLLKEISSVAGDLGEEKTKQAEYSAVKQADSVDSVNDLMAIAQDRMRKLKKLAEKRTTEPTETEAQLIEHKINGTRGAGVPDSEFRDLAMEINMTTIPETLDGVAALALKHIEKQKQSKTNLSKIKTEDLIAEIESRPMTKQISMFFADKVKKLVAAVRETNNLSFFDAFNTLTTPKSVVQDAPQEPQRGDNRITPSSGKKRR